MIPGNKYDAILLRYYLGECSHDERDFVIKWLKDGEGNQAHFANLIAVQKLAEIKDDLNKIDIDKEWQHCRQATDHSWNDLVQLHALVGEKEEVKRISHGSSKVSLFRISAAVVVALLLGIYTFYNYNKVDQVSKGVSSGKENLGVARGEDSPVISLRLQNTTGKIKISRLPDGSTVGLFRNSELTYQQPADRSRREVRLTGMAEFEVAKDRTKPFMVYSGHLSTTALGTKFVVRAYQQENRISVFLKEGKVIISSISGDGDSKVKEVILVPGQEMIYDRARQSALVLPSATKNVALRKGKLNDERIPDSTVSPNAGRNSWFMFHKQPLNDILDVLSMKYKVKIIYTKKDIDQMYVIGMFDRSDSLEDILYQIASLNDLKVIKEADTYTVEKRDPG